MLPAVTKRASIFSPMLNLNIVVSIISFAVYWRSNSLLVFLPWIVVLLPYSIYRHEKWAKDPETRGLLAPQKVAIKWLDYTMGDNKNIIEGEAIRQNSAIQNPEAKQLKEGGKK